MANLHNGNAIHESITDTFLKMKKPNRLAYKILVSKKQETHHRPPKGNGSRIARLKPKKILTGRQFTEHLFYAQKLQNSVIVFQFKLLHRRLATNSFLTKINLMDNEQCTFCQNDKENSHPPLLDL